MNVIHLKHDQFKINLFKPSRRGIFSAILRHLKFFRKLSTGEDFTRLYKLNLLYFKVFTGTSSLPNANQFPSTHANTSQACYSSSQMHYSHPSTLSSLSVPSSWNWEWRKKILRQRFGRRREKCFLVSGVLNFSMCQRKRSKNYQLSLMRPFSVGLKVFFSGCGFEFSWFFSRQRWKLFPSATHAYLTESIFARFACDTYRRNNMSIHIRHITKITPVWVKFLPAAREATKPSNN